MFQYFCQKKLNMKKLMTYSFALLIASTLISSCSKYEEGPKLALSSKKARLVGDWKLTKQVENDVEENLENYVLNLTISEDNSIKLEAIYTVLGVPFTTTKEGTWDFNSDKTQIQVTETGNSSSNSYIIVKLATKELKLKEVDGSDITVSTYEPR